MELSELFESAPQLRDLETSIIGNVEQLDEVVDYVLDFKRRDWFPVQLAEHDRIGWGPLLLAPECAPDGSDWDERSALRYAVSILRAVDRDRTTLLREAVRIASQPPPKHGLIARIAGYLRIGSIS